MGNNNMDTVYSQRNLFFDDSGEQGAEWSYESLVGLNFRKVKAKVQKKLKYCEKEIIIIWLTSWS